MQLKAQIHTFNGLDVAIYDSRHFRTSDLLFFKKQQAQCGQFIFVGIFQVWGDSG